MIEEDMGNVYISGMTEPCRGDVLYFLKIMLARIEDSSEILDLQKLAYKQEAEIYSDFLIPPLSQTLEDLQLEFSSKIVLKVMSEDNIVGSVRAFKDNNTCFIGRLIVHPEYQDKGIGAKLMQKIEEMFDTSKRYELFTGEKSKKNIYLYQKLGYRIYKNEELTEKVNMVFLEKLNN